MRREPGRLGTVPDARLVSHNPDEDANDGGICPAFNVTREELTLIATHWAAVHAEAVLWWYATFESSMAEQRCDAERRLAAVATDWRQTVLAAVPTPGEERFPVGYPGSPHTELPARDGMPHGEIERNAKAPNCSHFTHWTTTDDSITWTVDVLSAGTYEAVLWYTCPVADAGATVRLSCASSCRPRACI